MVSRLQIAKCRLQMRDTIAQHAIRDGRREIRPGHNYKHEISRETGSSGGRSGESAISGSSARLGRRKLAIRPRSARTFATAVVWQRLALGRIASSPRSASGSGSQRWYAGPSSARERAGRDGNSTHARCRNRFRRSARLSERQFAGDLAALIGAEAIEPRQHRAPSGRTCRRMRTSVPRYHSKSLNPQLQILSYGWPPPWQSQPVSPFSERKATILNHSAGQ